MAPISSTPPPAALAAYQQATKVATKAADAGDHRRQDSVQISKAAQQLVDADGDHDGGR